MGDVNFLVFDHWHDEPKLLHEGIRVAKLTVHEPTLDDVFLQKTGRSLEGAGDDGDEPEVQRGQMQSATT